jgi:F-type H+-transporting ATPase subunit alpha
LASYRELAAFSQFASDLDDETRKQLEHGQRVTELMKQKQYAPLSVAEMASSLFAANEGYLTELAVEKVLPFESALHAYLNSEHKDLMDGINASGDYNDDIKGKLKAALDKFVETQRFLWHARVTAGN